MSILFWGEPWLYYTFDILGSDSGLGVLWISYRNRLFLCLAAGTSFCVLASGLTVTTKQKCASEVNRLQNSRINALGLEKGGRSRLDYCSENDPGT
jgi:hypothetical protein